MNIELQGECRHYVTYSGVKLPLRLVAPLDERELENRNTFFRGYYNAQDRIVACQKVVYGEIEFEHLYEYYPGGVLKAAVINHADEEPRMLYFDEQGRPVAG